MNEIKNNGIKLSEYDKEQPFRVPAKYFDDFYPRLQAKLEAEENVLPKQKYSVIKFLKPALGLAASFALIFMLVYRPLHSYLPNYLAKIKTGAESTIEEDNYFSIVERIDENSFFALITESLVNGTADEKGFNEEELLSYLSSNISDYEIALQTEN
jgi:hypothetical protein